LPGGQLPVTVFEIESLWNPDPACKAVMLSPHDRYEMQIYWKHPGLFFHAVTEKQKLPLK
jgi:hypothetical protein